MTEETTNPNKLGTPANPEVFDGAPEPDGKPGTDPNFGEQQALNEAGALELGSVPKIKLVLEAALLSSSEPLTVLQLKRLFGGEVDADTVRRILDEMRGEWQERAIELTSVASGWRFRVKPEYQVFLDRISNEKAPRYSRAVLETLAIVAYRQPVTRGDIEDVRGVAVAPATLNALVERGWVEAIGHRETPGRPAIFATTKKFLDDLNLRSLEELPPLDELQSTVLAQLPGVVPSEDETPTTAELPQAVAPSEDAAQSPPES